jgi:hypothetical protein
MVRSLPGILRQPMNVASLAALNFPKSVCLGEGRTCGLMCFSFLCHIGSYFLMIFLIFSLTAGPPLCSMAEP